MDEQEFDLIIEQALKNGVKELDLSSTWLTPLPATLWELIDLTSLDLSHWSQVKVWLGKSNLS